MPLDDIQIKPGILTEASDREVGKLGFWKDCQWVRFFNGLPEMMGGYSRDGTSSVLGRARGIVDWMSLDGGRYVGVGTNIRLYTYYGSAFYNITPATTGLLANAFSTTINLTSVNVLHVAHGRAPGDYVYFDPTTTSAIGGSGVELNDGWYTVTTVVDTDNYTVTHSGAVATATAGPGGGAAVAYIYELGVGLESSSTGAGWGTSTYSRGGWGSATSGTAVTAEARVWALDMWGEDLLANPNGGGLYVWDTSAGVATRAAAVSGAPATMESMIVSTEDRRVIALGAHDGSNDSPLNIRWCSDENYTDWTPTETNTAGDKLLDRGSYIVCGVKGRGEHLIFTNTHVYAMVHVGPPLIYDFRPLGDNGGIMGPMAAHAYAGITYWMSGANFYMYNGTIEVLPCSVHGRVFRDINIIQSTKIKGAVNRKYNEVWWFYPSADSDENDRYVVYNTADKNWVYGDLARTEYVGDSDLFLDPYAIGTDGYFYNHETGLTANGAGIEAFVESGDVELDQDGNAIMHLSKFVPDMKRLEGAVDITFTGKKYPNDSEIQVSGPHTLNSSTRYINPRMRARQVSIKVESSGTVNSWRFGLLRVDQKPHGGR